MTARTTPAPEGRRGKFTVNGRSASITGLTIPQARLLAHALDKGAFQCGPEARDMVADFAQMMRSLMNYQGSVGRERSVPFVAEPGEHELKEIVMINGVEVVDVRERLAPAS